MVEYKNIKFLSNMNQITDLSVTEQIEQVKNFYNQMQKK